MLKNIHWLLLLIAIPTCGQTVQDTIWMRGTDEIVVKKQADAYKILTRDKDNKSKLYISLYDKKTKIIKSSGYGIVNEDETDFQLDESTIYTDQGKVKFVNSFDHDNNVAKVHTTDMRNGEKYECIFEGNIPYNGKMFFRERGTFLYLEVTDGNTNTIELYNPDNLKNFLKYKYTDKGNPAKEEYYDEKGELLYTAIYKDNEFYNGTRITLSNNLFKIKGIESKQDGETIEATQYYLTGELKSKALRENNTFTQIFYKQDGSVLGQQSFVKFFDKLVEREGVLYNFLEQENEDDITLASHYENNKLVKLVQYYSFPKKNNIESITYLKKGTDFGFEQIEYFNEDGVLQGTVTFDDKGLNIVNGTAYKKNNKTVTKDGVIVENTTYYSNGRAFQFTKDLVSTFYDTKGKEIGKVTLNNTEDPDKLYNTGTVFTMEDDLITQVTTYENNVTTTDKIYNIDNETSELVLDIIYRKGNPYQTTMYYLNGNKAIEYVYGMKDYSTLAKGTFYKDTGELIGTYDYIYETGTLVKYTDNLEIVSIETTQDGKPLTKKEFGIYNDGKILSKPGYYLYSYIDYSKSEETYDELGEMQSSTEYRDGKPYEGLAYTFDTENGTAIETAYKEGKKVDKETIKDTETNETLRVNFYEEGELKKTATYNEGALFKISGYKDNQLEGMTSFFSPDNKLISTISFNENLPVEGTYIYQQDDVIVKTSFKDKNQVSKQIYKNTTTGKETLVVAEKYVDSNTINRTVYNHITGKLIYDYNIKNNVLDGLFKYYEGDRLKHQATFENGKISDGTVAIIDFNFDPITGSHEDYPNHTVITKSKNTYYITVLDESKKELLNMQIKETAGDNNYNSLFNTPLPIERLYPYNPLNNTPSEWKAYAPHKPGDLKPNPLDSIF